MCCHALRSTVGCSTLCNIGCNTASPAFSATPSAALNTPLSPPLSPPPSPAQIGLASLSVGQPCCLAALRRALVTRGLPARPSRAAEGAGGAEGVEGAEGAEGAELVAPSFLTAEKPFVDDPPPRRAGPAAAVPRGEAAAGSRGDVAALRRPCSNSILWRAGAGARAGATTGGGAAASMEAINGLAGVRLGANTKGGVSPKHRAAACKALLLRRFLRVCAALPAEALPPPLRVLPARSERSYRELKKASAAYQQRRASLLGSEAFRDWVCAPESCEAFTDAAGPLPAR